MKPIITINKRGSTPSTNQKPSPNINISRKIVDANHSNQIKKVPIQSIINRTNTNDEQIKQINKPMGSFIDKYNMSHIPTNGGGGVFENFTSKMQNMNPIYTQHPQNSPQFLAKQPSNSSSYQPFGVQEQDKGNIGQYPMPQFNKKSELRKEDITSSDIYKDLIQKYEAIAEKLQELKNDRQELQEAVKGRDEQIKKLKFDYQKNLQENIMLKRKNQELLKQNKTLKEQIQQQQNEERKDNHEQILEMMYAIRMHQQEEQMLQMAIQQSAEEVQTDPNFVNIDNMTYEQILELEEKNGKVSRGLPEEVIEQIPIVTFNSRYKAISEKCTICISEFEQGEKLKQLPCKHIYHVECVESWLKHEKKCPVCKGEICYN